MITNIEIVKEILNRKDENQKLFKKIYNNPTSVLGKQHDLDEIEKEFLNLPNLKQLMFNREFTWLCCDLAQDEEFIKSTKGNEQIWMNMHRILCESLDFHKVYWLKDDRDIMATLNGKMAVEDYEEQHEYSLSKAYKFLNKYKRFYDDRYYIDKARSYDRVYTENALWYIASIIEDIYAGLDKEKITKETLKQISEEDCSIDVVENTFLTTHNLIDSDYKMFMLLCNNEFVDLIDKKLKAGELGGISAETAFSVIAFSWCIKKYYADNCDRYIRMIGYNNVREFDVDRAYDLYYDLLDSDQRKANTKPYQKIITFPTAIDM
jgi:hypothetical protein